MFHLPSKASSVVVGSSSQQVRPEQSNHYAHPFHAVAKRPCPFPEKTGLAVEVGQVTQDHMLTQNKMHLLLGEIL